MIINITASIVKDFEKAGKAYKRASNSALRRAGAYVRRVAMNSIRRGTIVGGKMIASKPGTPPRYWAQYGLNFRQSILYKVDGDEVVVGPIAGRHGKLGALHEFGGSQMIDVYDKDSGKKRSVLANYPARPFMAPALARSKRRISKFWEDTVK